MFWQMIIAGVCRLSSFSCYCIVREESAEGVGGGGGGRAEGGAVGGGDRGSAEGGGTGGSGSRSLSLSPSVSAICLSLFQSLYGRQTMTRTGFLSARYRGCSQLRITRRVRLKTSKEATIADSVLILSDVGQGTDLSNNSPTYIACCCY